MAAWNYIVIGLCLLMLVLLIYKENSRLNKSKLAGRIIMSILAVVSLACLAFTFKTSIQLNNKKTTAILLTEGFNKDSLNFYIKNNNPTFTIEDYPPNQTFDTLHILGYGLSKSEQNNINASNLIFHPNEIISGINSADWQHRLNAHELFTVQGNFDNTFSTPVKISLKAYNNSVDSITIAANTKQNFSLKTMPQHIGKAIFNLIAINNKDTVEQEPIPFEVLPANKLNVLMLASSPDFDNKFLSTWLAENGFTVALRTTISKNKFKQSFLDTSKFSLNHISSEVLNKFDVLVSDATELATISSQELNAIKNQISTNGLGLIIKADSNIIGSFYHNIFPVKATLGNNNEIINVRIQDSSYQLTTDHANFIQQQAGTQPLISDNQNRLLANSSLYGTGKIILTTPDNTFSWLLANNTHAYQNYWSILLQQAAHKSILQANTFIGTMFPFVNQAVNIVVTNQNPISKIHVNESFVSLQQNALLPFLANGTYWPTTSGWQSTVLNDASINWWYAYNASDWKPIANKQKVQDTYQFIINKKNDNQVQNQNGTTQTKPFPKIIFLLIFFISCIYLWVEKKLM